MKKLINITEKTDQVLVNSVKSKADNEAFNEICRRYENIFYKICQKYVNVLINSGVNPQDIFDEKHYIIFHCVTTYDPSKNTKLSTWIGNYARYLCLNAINARRFILPTTDEDIKKRIEEAQVTQQYLQGSTTHREDFNYILNILSQLKDERITQIFKLRYSGNKLIWSKVAKKVGISTQTAINLHNKGLFLLRRKIKSRNISDVI